MSFINSFVNFFSKKKKVVEVPLDATSIKENHTIKALAYQNAELKGENAKLKQQIAQQRESEKDVQEEENVKAYLDTQKKEIKFKSQGKVFSMKSFWAKYFKDKKFRSRLGFYTWDRKTKLATFGDIVFTEKGNVAFLDKNKQLVMPPMSNLSDAVQSPGALATDIMRGIIPMNLDEEGDYIENIMASPVSELIPTEDGKLQFSKVKKAPVYEILKNQGNQIGELLSEVAEKEDLITKLQNKIDKLESERKVYENVAETSRAELSDSEDRMVGVDKIHRRNMRDLLRLQNLNLIQHDENERLTTMFEVMRKEAEREGVKISDEKAREVFERARSTIVNELPDVITAPARTEEAVAQGPIIKKK